MPFTVITLKKSTPSLRGDLTKWMQEIATGVYIGNFNARIREKLWIRITETVGDGEATMSYAYRNEIGYQFVTWNTERENIDCDGIPLVLLPICKEMLHKGEMTSAMPRSLEKPENFQAPSRRKKHHRYRISLLILKPMV